MDKRQLVNEIVKYLDYARTVTLKPKCSIAVPFNKDLIDSVIEEAIKESTNSILHRHFKLNSDLGSSVLTKFHFLFPFEMGEQIHFDALSEPFTDLINYLRIDDNQLCINNLKKTEIKLNTISCQSILDICKEDKEIKSFYMPSNLWNDWVGNYGFENYFDPVSKYELLLKGLLGSIEYNGVSIKCYTDAYEHPNNKFIDKPFIIYENTGEAKVKYDIQQENNKLTINKEFGLIQAKPVYVLI